MVVCGFLNEFFAYAVEFKDPNTSKPPRHDSRFVMGLWHSVRSSAVYT